MYNCLTKDRLDFLFQILKRQRIEREIDPKLYMGEKYI